MPPIHVIGRDASSVRLTGPSGPAAMISAVDDGVGAIMAELERLGMADNTCNFFTTDNGPSRESRNWLDGNQDPYYGGSAGMLKGHKFSLYEGGIRVPGIMHWPGVIPRGQVRDEPYASMDIFSTALTAAGGEITPYELDGTNLLPYVCDGEIPQTRTIFWEQNNQTAVRRGDWKLVLQGQLVEGAPPEDDVHLSNLAEDLGETRNLAAEEPTLTAELTTLAEEWRQQIEARWQSDYAALNQGVTTYIPDHERT